MKPLLTKLRRDSHPSAAAVEARLREVRPGEVIVQRRDGSLVVAGSLAEADAVLDLDKTHSVHGARSTAEQPAERL